MGLRVWVERLQRAPRDEKTRYKSQAYGEATAQGEGKDILRSDLLSQTDWLRDRRRKSKTYYSFPRKPKEGRGIGRSQEPCAGHQTLPNRWAFWRKPVLLGLPLNELLEEDEGAV